MVIKLKKDKESVYTTKIQNRGRKTKYTEDEQKEIAMIMEDDRRLTAKGVARNNNINTKNACPNVIDKIAKKYGLMAVIAKDTFALKPH